MAMVPPATYSAVQTRPYSMRTADAHCSRGTSGRPWRHPPRSGQPVIECTCSAIQSSCFGADISREPLDSRREWLIIAASSLGAAERFAKRHRLVSPLIMDRFYLFRTRDRIGTLAK